MIDTLRDVHRSLLLWRIWLRLGIQDVNLRFRRSAIGMAWIFINLTISVLSIGLIYGVLFKLEVKTFIPLLTVSLITWGYFMASIVDGGNAFVASEGYIKQIGLPVYVYIFRWFVSISLTTLLSFVTYVVVMLVFGVQVRIGILWVVPGLFLAAAVSLLAISIFAHLNAHFRDTSHLASSIMQVVFFITPVIWPAETLRERGFDYIVDFNPFYHLLEVVRQPLLHSEPASYTNYIVTAGIILAMSGLALTLLRYYRRRLVFIL